MWQGEVKERTSSTCAGCGALATANGAQVTTAATSKLHAAAPLAGNRNVVAWKTPSCIAAAPCSAHWPSPAPGGGGDRLRRGVLDHLPIARPVPNQPSRTHHPSPKQVLHKQVLKSSQTCPDSLQHPSPQLCVLSTIAQTTSSWHHTLHRTGALSRLHSARHETNPCLSADQSWFASLTPALTQSARLPACGR